MFFKKGLHFVETSRDCDVWSVRIDLLSGRVVLRSWPRIGPLSIAAAPGPPMMPPRGRPRLIVFYEL